MGGPGPGLSRSGLSGINHTAGVERLRRLGGSLTPLQQSRDTAAYPIDTPDNILNYVTITVEIHTVPKLRCLELKKFSLAHSCLCSALLRHTCNRI